MPVWSESVDQIAASFKRNGFAVAEGLADQKCLDKLLPIYDAFIDGSIECPTGMRRLGGLTRQIINPHLYSSELRDNTAVENAYRIAKRLQEVDEPDFVFSMMIYKPGPHPHQTPWHQDVSYAAAPTMPKGTSVPNNVVLTFWLALNDVSEDMGCMEFLPGKQDDPIPQHFVYSGEPQADDRLLAIANSENIFDLSKSQKCPLDAGSATIHGYNTPHFTEPNQTNRPRRALIFSFNRPDAQQVIGREITRLAAA